MKIFLKQYCLLIALFMLLIFGGAQIQARFFTHDIALHFDLIDQNGRSITEKTLPKGPKLVFFGYTRCSGICPTTLSKLVTVQKVLEQRHRKAEILFVTIDSGHDTPPVLLEYLAHFSSRIIGLTGTPENLKALYNAFQIYPGNTGQGIMQGDHSGLVYLVDAQGNLQKTFTAQTTAEALATLIAPSRQYIKKEKI